MRGSGGARGAGRGGGGQPTSLSTLSYSPRNPYAPCLQVVEDGYEFFGDRSLVTVFSAPNYCGEFDNSGAMMRVDEELVCSFQVLKPVDSNGQRWGAGRPGTPPRNRKG